MCGRHRPVTLVQSRNAGLVGLWENLCEEFLVIPLAHNILTLGRQIQVELDAECRRVLFFLKLFKVTLDSHFCKI